MNAGSTSESNTETELRALEKSFSDAIVSNDASAVERFLATDWVIIDPDGSHRSVAVPRGDSFRRTET